VLEGFKLAPDSPGRQPVVCAARFSAGLRLGVFIDGIEQRPWAPSAQTLPSDQRFLLRTVAWAFPMGHEADCASLSMFFFLGSSILLITKNDHPLGPCFCQSLN